MFADAAHLCICTSPSVAAFFFLGRSQFFKHMLNSENDSFAVTTSTRAHATMASPTALAASEPEGVPSAPLAAASGRAEAASPPLRAALARIAGLEAGARRRASPSHLCTSWHRVVQTWALRGRTWFFFFERDELLLWARCLYSVPWLPGVAAQVGKVWHSAVQIVHGGLTNSEQRWDPVGSAQSTRNPSDWRPRRATPCQ